MLEKMGMKTMTTFVLFNVLILATSGSVVRTEQQNNNTVNDLDSYTSTVMTKISDEKITEYISAMINTTYIDKVRRQIYTSMKLIGRYSSGGIASFTGLATLLPTQDDDNNDMSSESGCHEPTNFTRRSVPIIAIIKRGHCTFDKKVANAEKMGAIGVIIYDNEAEDKLKSIQVKKGRIPAVFTFKNEGEKIVNAVLEGHNVYVSVWEGQLCSNKENSQQIQCKDFYETVNPNHKGIQKNKTPTVSSESISGYVALVAVSIAILMAILITLFLQYYYHNMNTLQNKERMERKLGKKTKQALNHVTLFVAQGSEGDCSICIEQIKQGEEARHLPCGHTFHRPCVDDWLLKRRKCPLCNLNIVEYFGLLDANCDISEDSLGSMEASGITAL